MVVAHKTDPIDGATTFEQYYTLLKMIINSKDKQPLPENVDELKSKEWYLERVAEVGRAAKVPIIQVAYKDRTRKILLESANFDSAAARPDATTVFQAASISKVLFSYIVMLLVDEGKIDLDKPLYEYTGGIVEDRFKDAVPGNAEASARNEAWAKLITARIVLTHSTGLPNWMRNGGASNAKLVMSQAPGKGFTYSGEGIYYLQRVVEHITGLTLNQLADKYVFVPLGMTHSSYKWRDEYAQLAAYAYNADMMKGSQRTSMPENAAYSLRTNAKDFSLFLEAAVIEGRGLKPDTYTQWLSAQRLIKPGYYYGLGIRISPNTDSESYGPLLSHGGSNGGTSGFRCKFWIFPKQQTYCVYFTNSVNGGGNTEKKIYQLFFPQYPDTKY
jgi:CubicO group peptidase (beta-lactamase class C family)